MIAYRPTSPRSALEWLSALALASTLLAGASIEARAGDGMVGGELALKGQVTSTVGPNGATGQPASVLSFTDEEMKKLRAGHYSVALLLQTSSDWANAVTLGAQDELKALGLETAGLSNSNFSASDQAHAVGTLLAKNPSGIAVWPINPDELRPALQKASDAGVKLALISNMPSGFRQGKDYVGLVGDDLFAMGQKTAEGVAKAIGGEGDIGFLYFDANAYVVNQRDAAFRTTIEKEFPKIKIAATQGFSDPSRAFQIASAMILQNPNLKAIYAPWSEPAAGVLQADSRRPSHRYRDRHDGSVEHGGGLARAGWRREGADHRRSLLHRQIAGRRDRLFVDRQSGSRLHPGAGHFCDQRKHSGRLLPKLPRRAPARSPQALGK